MIHSSPDIGLSVINTIDLSDTCVSVVFARPISFNYEPGDWIDLNFSDGNPPGGTTYSLSSSPTEDTLAITFKRGISPFKNRLQSLKQGDRLYISQYGNDYEFHLKVNRSSVLIAGGIGIAPFRSMIKAMSDTTDSSDVRLIYMSKDRPFIFADEINNWQQQLPNLTVHYVDTRDLNRKKREKLMASLVPEEADLYYIAGPESMVESTEHFLIDHLDINSKAVRIDSFGGY